jgi:DNA-binding beta-propeller fold protein YncE
LAYDIALTPNGKTIYVLTPRGVIPIRTASRTVLPMIAIPDVENPSFDPFVITPDGRAVWVATNAGILPISTATNTAGSLIKVGAPGSIAFAR